MMNFTFYSCILEGRQLFFEEPFLLAASEVVRAVCKAGFQNNSEFLFEYAQPPKDGMYLFKVTRKTDGFSTLVFFDTRTKPNFIWVEKVFDNNPDLTINQFVKMLEAALNAGSYQYGWKVWLDKFVPNDIRNVDLLCSAVTYVDDYLEGVPIFNTYVKDAKIEGEVMKILHQKLDHKHKAILMMKVLRAAYDADLIEKPEYESFIREFNKIGKICIASYNRYMTKDNPFADDKDYQSYLHDFEELKRNRN